MLATFTHDPSPSMTYGIDRLAGLHADVADLVGELASILLITDAGLMATGMPLAIAERLREAGHSVEVFCDVESDPSVESVDAAAQAARILGANLIIGLGGGSPLDVAKLAACVAVADEPASAYATLGRPLPVSPIKKILIPTTSGTGAEMTRTCVYGIDQGRKVWAWGPTLKANLSILDAMVSRGLPAGLTAATGLDALVHAIEACTHKRVTPVVEGMALQAIRLVAGNLERVVRTPGDLDRCLRHRDCPCVRPCFGNDGACASRPGGVFGHAGSRCRGQLVRRRTPARIFIFRSLWLWVLTRARAPMISPWRGPARPGSRSWCGRLACRCRLRVTVSGRRISSVWWTLPWHRRTGRWSMPTGSRRPMLNC